MKTISLQDANRVVAMTAEQLLRFREQGFTDFSIKQVNDPNDEGDLQEMILVDMKKDGEQFEIRMFAKKQGEKIKVKVKEAKDKIPAKEVELGLTGDNVTTVIIN